MAELFYVNKCVSKLSSLYSTPSKSKQMTPTIWMQILILCV